MTVLTQSAKLVATKCMKPNLANNPNLSTITFESFITLSLILSVPVCAGKSTISSIILIHRIINSNIKVSNNHDL